MQVGIGADGPIRGRRVAVTGLGAITCCGVGVDALWDGLLHPSVIGGCVRGYEPQDFFGPKEVRQLDRFAQLSMVSADMAVQAAGELAVDPAKAGVVFATGVGGLETLADQVGVFDAKGPDRVSPRLVPMMMANAGAAGISMRLGWRGPSEVICTACAAGTHAIAAAARLVASGRCDVAIGGGSEASMVPVALAAFANMTALSTSGNSRPFDARRDGFVMTEGAAALVLEEWDRAVARGATIYAELAGTASTADAHHITAPSPDGSGAVACMELALADADIAPVRRRAHQRPRHLDAPERPGRSAGHHQGVRRAWAARDVDQGGDRPRARRGRRDRGGGWRADDPSRHHPADRRVRGARPRDLDPGRARGAQALGARRGAVQLLRVRRAQRLPRPAATWLSATGKVAPPLPPGSDW